MTHERDIPPAELRALARARSQARREHRFADADRIRAEIEAQGWNVVDRGAEARLVRAHPLDLVDPDGATRYGWSGAVPEAIDGSAGVTVVLRALPEVGATDPVVARLTGGGSHPRRIIVVAGEGHQDPSLGDVDVVRLRGEVGPGTLLAVALRRVTDGVIVVGERWPADAVPDDIDALARRLADDRVAATGLVGLRSSDLRRFAAGGAADTPVEAVGWSGLTFRVRDGRACGPVDEGFSDADLLAAWWSLVLRDGPDEPSDGPGGPPEPRQPGGPPEPRQAIAIRTTEATPDDDQPLRDDRATRRDRYRLIDRFAGRDDLIVR